MRQAFAVERFILRVGAGARICVPSRFIYTEVPMSLIKVAIYGGIGYLVYQTFFAEMPASGTERGRSRRGESPRGSEESSGRSRMSGGGRGRTESTEEPTGASTPH